MKPAHQARPVGTNRNGPDPSRPLRCESLGQEFTAVSQAFLVDAMANPGRHVPFGRDFEGGEILGGQEQRLRRDKIVAVAMHQEDRRAPVLGLKTTWAFQPELRETTLPAAHTSRHRNSERRCCLQKRSG